MSEAEILKKLQSYADALDENLGVLNKMSEASGWNSKWFIDALTKRIRGAQIDAGLGKKKEARRVLAFVEGVLWSAAIIELPVVF